MILHPLLKLATGILFFASLTSANSVSNAHLLRLFQEDQSDRDSGVFLMHRDAERRKQVEQMIVDNLLLTAEDFYRAAVIFQHGQSPSDYKKAQQLASKAAILKPDFIEARWLTCAAEDRYLISIGEPQVWGTQYSGFEPSLEPINRHAKTDKEREVCGLPPLKEIEMSLEKEN